MGLLVMALAGAGSSRGGLVSHGPSRSRRVSFNYSNYSNYSKLRLLLPPLSI